MDSPGCECPWGTSLRSSATLRPVNRERLVAAEDGSQHLLHREFHRDWAVSWRHSSGCGGTQLFGNQTRARWTTQQCWSLRVHSARALGGFRVVPSWDRTRRAQTPAFPWVSWVLHHFLYRPASPAGIPYTAVTLFFRSPVCPRVAGAGLARSSSSSAHLIRSSYKLLLLLQANAADLQLSVGWFRVWMELMSGPSNCPRFGVWVFSLSFKLIFF